MRSDKGRPKNRIPAPPMDQFNYCLKEVSDQMMHLVICFTGRIDESQLKTAFSSSLELVPVFCSRFVEREKPFWEGVPDLDPDILFHIHSSPAEALADAMVVPIDPAEGPPIRLDLVRSGTDVLCITVHHAATDARGLEEYAAILASLYRGVHPAQCTSNTGMENLDRSLRPFFDCFSMEALAEAAAVPPVHTCAWAFPHESLECRKRSFAFRRLPEGSAGRVGRFARNRAATVNDALIGAAFLALCEYNAPGPGTPLPILFSVDLRRHLPAGSRPDRKDGSFSSCGLSAIRNYSVAQELTLYSGAPCPDALLPDIAAVMHRLKAGNIGLASALEIESLETGGLAAVRERIAAMQETYRTTGCKTPLFANIGIIPEEPVDFGPDCPVGNAFLAGMVGYPPGIVFAASTFRDSITLSMGYCTEAVPPEIAEGFLESVARNLPGPGEP